MKTRLVLVLPLGILSVILLLVMIFVSTGLWQKLVPDKSSSSVDLETKSSDRLLAQPELSEVAKKRRGLIGPFPVGNDIPEPERKIGRVMNAWREAVVIKSINDISRLGLEIKHYGENTIS